MAKRKTKFNWNWVFLILFLLLILLLAGFLYFGFKEDGFLRVQQQVVYINVSEDGVGPTTTTGNGEDLFETCDELCAEEGYSDGWDALFDDGHDCAMAGATFIEYGYEGEDPLLSCCCDNIPPEEEPPEDEGYNVGDIVGGGTEGGTLYGPGAGTTIDLSDVEIGGPCHLGARIWTSWEYENEQDCFGIQGMEGLEWNFYDSTGHVWGVTDYTPRSNYVDLCPLVYDGQTNWRIEMIKLFGFPECGIVYDWKVEVCVCECD